MSPFRWASVEWLYWLPVVPLVVVFFWWLMKRQAGQLARHVSSRLLPFMQASLHPNKRKLKLVLEAFVIALLVLALARLQLGQQERELKSQGVEVMLLLDLSRSMLAEDVRPSRLELAKREIGRFLDLSTGNRVGLVIFAGSAVALAPLTTDFSALKMYMDSLSPDSVPTQGTNFYSALSEAHEAFIRSRERDEHNAVVTRVVVMVSDGENHEEEATRLVRQMVSENIRVFTVGVGTAQGGPIPLRDQRGHLRGHHRDREGNVVVTTANPEVLQNLAREGRGSYYHMTFGGDAMQRLSNDLRSLEQSQFESTQILDWDERYQIFLVFALLFAFIELSLGERRPQARLWRGRFEVGES